MEEKNIEKLLDELIAEASGPVIQKLTEEDLKHLDDAYPYEISKEHEEKMKEIFKKADLYANNKNMNELESNSKVIKLKTFRKALVVAVIFVFVLAISCVGAFRDSFVKYYLSIKDEFSGVKKNEVIQDYNIDNIYFGFMPSEYSLTEKKAKKNSSAITFMNSEGKYITLDIHEREYGKKVNTEDGIIEELVINEKDMVYTERENMKLLTWREEGKIFLLCTNDTKEFLLKIVENMEILD